MMSTEIVFWMRRASCVSSMIHNASARVTGRSWRRESLRVACERNFSEVHLQHSTFATTPMELIRDRGHLTT
ncbi:hypothetical protein K458DRAFT_160840 [Lentithecium fluviatile CBS 122367]|uniref:Uncharacterized protein n=1 Tax=Lentithecium fluviatile CBS 122367 TaxID=1168545 RepID=A0A6G1IHU2_9PLEO|nr:hypothetical protein K458DRAFT_160840 [Lentithecium fluviatile CBS 122367]